MADIRLRPRFRTHVECDPASVLALIEAQLGSPGSDASGRIPANAQIAGTDVGHIEGTVFDTSAVLRIPSTRRHFWSPELQVGVDGDEAGTMVSGLFGPRPGVWSMYVALYAFVLFVAIMGSSFGASQIMLDQRPFAFWSLPAALVGALAVYGIGRVGRRLGREQIRELDAFLDRVLAACRPSQGNSAT